MAELTGQVASCSAKGKDGSAGKKVVERFFFNGINAKATGAAIGGENDLILLSGSNETQTSLAFAELAKSWAEIALYATIFQGVPVFCGHSIS